MKMTETFPYSMKESCNRGVMCSYELNRVASEIDICHFFIPLQHRLRDDLQ